MSLRDTTVVGSLVWFDGSVGYLLPGAVVTVLESHLKILAEDNRQFYTVAKNHVLPRKELGPCGVEDMIKMEDLHEGSILMNIRKQYKSQQIYTYIGNILVAVNPYLQCKIYGHETIEKYRGQPLGIQPPHIFAIANAVYEEMLRESLNQVVIISGESGAGKTESAKLLVHYLAAVNQSKSKLITEQLVEATPLLESFGNAKTVKNDNASRFAKYLEVFFSNYGAICGGRVTEYGLDRSRIVQQSPCERNYHIFYEMLAGLSEVQKQKLHLGNAEDYFFLNQGKACVVPNKNDASHFQHVVSAMEVLGIKKKEREGIFGVLAAILHIGNITFSGSMRHSEEITCIVCLAKEVQTACQLLMLDEDDLRMTLTSKQTETRKDRLVTPRSLEQAVEARDAVAKDLYSRLFTWLVNRINAIISNEKQHETTIAILDMFGFENFKINSFEQLCINYANESLQFFFNQFVFRIEQEQYFNEGIKWKEVQFVDNQPCLDLLARPPSGILQILSDESSLRKASDSSFLEKCHHSHKHSKYYEKSKAHKQEFAIHHYAGTVWYKVDGFHEKNRYGLEDDLYGLITRSKSQFLQELYPELQGEENVLRDLRLPSGSKTSLRLHSKLQKGSVCAAFNDSLIRLIQTMKSCKPWFVRCIKPNNEKAPLTFDSSLVWEQLNHCGLLETAKIRKEGYPVRYTFDAFVRRYGCISSQLALNAGTSRENCINILSFVNAVFPPRYQMGETKIFLRENLHQLLEEARFAKLNRVAVVIQAKMRGYFVSQEYLRMKKAVIVLQSNSRRYLQRKKYLRARRGIIVLQALFRMKRQKKIFQKISEGQRLQKEDKGPANEKVPTVYSETKEWEKEATMDVTHLEIPADLALVFANLQGWNIVHRKEVVQLQGDIVEKGEDVFSLPDNIDSYLFSKFVHQHFREGHQWGACTTPITHSLLKLKFNDDVEAVSVFKLVMRFMKDSSLTGSRRFATGNFIIQKGVLNPLLRDEIYCQLCNQTWGNDDNCEAGWLLMALCLSCFAPSQELYRYLLKYVSDQAFNGYKSYCQHKLLCWNMDSTIRSRAHPPSVLEWEAAEQRAAMALDCHCGNGEKRTVAVNSCTTGGRLAQSVLEDCRLADGMGWSVDLQDDNFHISLSAQDYVYDLISQLEYPPGLRYNFSPALLSLKQNHKFTAKELKALADLNKVQISKGANVSEMVTKFASKEKTSQAVQREGPREDALSTATKDKLANSAPRLQEDKLVSATALKTRDLSVPSPSFPLSQSTAPSSSTLTEIFIPPPPPPPPVVPPPDKSALKRKVTKKDKKEKKKQDNAPSYSLAEVVAKAKRMSEARNSLLSIEGASILPKDTPKEDQFDSAIIARVSELKSTMKVEVPPIKENYEENELKKALKAKSKRVSAAWEENEKALEEMKAYKQSYLAEERKENVSEELKLKARRVRQSWVEPKEKERSFSNAARYSKDDDNCGNPMLVASTDPCLVAMGQSEMNDFVDSLFHPVLTDEVDDLTNEDHLKAAIKGGGGVQPGGISSSEFNSHDGGPAQGKSNGNVTTLKNAEKVNGYPGIIPSNGHPWIPQDGVAGSSNHSQVGKESVDQTLLVAQQQLLIEQLLSNQTMLQRQQDWLNLRQQEQLFLLTQHQAAMQSQQLQHTQHIPLQQNNPQNTTSFQTSSSTLPSGETSVLNNGLLTVSIPKPEPQILIVHDEGTSTDDLPPPPVEFSDGVLKNDPLVSDSNTALELNGSPQLPSSISALNDSPSSPPPPRSSSFSTTTASSKEVNVGRKASASVGEVALVVAALEAKDTSTQVQSQNLPQDGTVTAIQVKEKNIGVVSKVKSPSPSNRQLTDLTAMENKRTRLYSKRNSLYLTYSNQVKWKLTLRKEIFLANEKIENPQLQHLIYLQIVQDAYNSSCCKMNSVDRRNILHLLQRYQISLQRTNTSAPVEQIIIDAARQLPVYFSRFFVVSVQNEMPDVKYLAVSERGLKLLKRDKITDDLCIVKDYDYGGITKVKALKNRLTVTTGDEQQENLHLTIERAAEVKRLIDPYMRQLEKEGKYVRAMYDYITQEQSFLNFKKGDVIKVIDKPIEKEGWLFGVCAGHTGYFPSEYVTHIKETPLVQRRLKLTKASSMENLVDGPLYNTGMRSRSGSVRSTKSDKSEYGADKLTMMEFAMNYFRFGRVRMETQRKAGESVRGTLKLRGTMKGGRKKKPEWTWKNEASLVKFSKSPIQASLLPHERSELNKLAIDCFIKIMKFMGDYPLVKGEKEADLVYFILKVCREHLMMVDEIYCQLAKQVTSNKSLQQDSCSRGWRLLIIVTAYVQPSELLTPYLVRFLQTTASDPKREFHGAAAICVQNLNKTLEYGGRKSPPSQMELNQLMQGRQTKRQIFLLPGEITKMLKIQTCSTGEDVVKELCTEMGLVREYAEYGLFTLFRKENTMFPIQTTDYVMDIVSQLERQDVAFSLCFRRVLWCSQCQLHNELLVSFIYHQVLPDYLAGYLLGFKAGQPLVDPTFQNLVAELGALQLFARNETVAPSQQRTMETLIPVPMYGHLRSQQWLILVQDHFRGFHRVTPHQARKRFLEIISKWPYFGSTFFYVKHVSNPAVSGDSVMAINSRGVHFLSPLTKETLLNVPFVEIISTRILLSDKGRQFLDLKLGNQMVQKVTRLETQESKDVSNLIFRYVEMIAAEDKNVHR